MLLSEPELKNNLLDWMISKSSKGIDDVNNVIFESLECLEDEVSAEDLEDFKEKYKIGQIKAARMAIDEVYTTEELLILKKFEEKNPWVSEKQLKLLQTSREKGQELGENLIAELEKKYPTF